MAKKKERAVNVSGRPRHSLDVNRANDKKGAGADRTRFAATVRRHTMYGTGPKRDRGGKILKHDLQSKELPNARIEPDRRWFGGERTGGPQFSAKEKLQIGEVTRLNVVAEEMEGQADEIAADQEDERISRSQKAPESRGW